MYPELINITLSTGQAISVSAYRFFGLLAAGYLIALVVIHLRQYQVDAIRPSLLIIMMAAAFLLGSRMLYIVLYLPHVIDNPQMAITLRLRNFTLYGGLLLAAPTWWFLAKKSGINTLKFADNIIPHLGVSIIIMRVGCFLNGCCYGKPTGLPWGINVLPMSQAHLAQIYNSSGGIAALIPKAVHPTQIYEMIAALVASLAAWFFLKRRIRDGLATAIFCLLLSLGRLITFYCREFPAAGQLSNLIRGPVIYGLVLAVSAVWIYKIYVTAPQSGK